MPSLGARLAQEILVQNLVSDAAYTQRQLYTELCFQRGFWVINYDKYFYLSIILNFPHKKLRWAGHVARMGEGRGVHRVLVGISEGKRPLGRPRRRWEDNIKMDLQ